MEKNGIVVRVELDEMCLYVQSEAFLLGNLENAVSIGAARNLQWSM